MAGSMAVISLDTDTEDDLETPEKMDMPKPPKSKALRIIKGSDSTSAHAANEPDPKFLTSPTYVPTDAGAAEHNGTGQLIEPGSNATTGYKDIAKWIIKAPFDQEFMRFEEAVGFNKSKPIEPSSRNIVTCISME